MYRSLRPSLITLFMFLVVSSVQADEIGPSTCGYAIHIVGSVNHYASAPGYVVANATDQAMYVDEVYGKSFSAVVEDLPEGLYTVELFMAESYHKSAGQRSFNIHCMDSAIATSLDIFNEVGADAEYKITHQLLFSPEEADQELNIRFTTNNDNAKFNAIRVRNQDDSLVACVMASELFPVMEHNGNGNPFIQHMFTADPSAHVFGDRMYVYPSHDLHNSVGFNMRDYHVFSSSDLKEWTDHGVALDVEDVPWAKEYMWAPDCVYRDGTYYFYFPAKDNDGEFRIGVATSDQPAGPFIPEPEPIEGSFSVDPAVFIDDDGQAYMYFGGDGHGGQSTPWVAKLDNSMKEFSEAPVRLTGIDYWFEACWVHQIDGIYYMSYSTGTYHPQYPNRSAIAWATATDPMGPFSYQGVLNGYVSGWTNHHSTVEYRGQWYFFYHNSDLSGGNTNRRSICADYLHFNEDASMRKVSQTTRGIGSYHGGVRLEAENYSETGGVMKGESSNGGLHVSFDPGDSLVFNQVEFPQESGNTITAHLASDAEAGTLEIYNRNGTLLGQLDQIHTGGLQEWLPFSAPVQDLKDTMDLILVYQGPEGSRLNLDWFLFSDVTGGDHRKINDNVFRLYPNPVKELIYIDSEDYEQDIYIRICDATGKVLLSDQLQEGSINIGELKPGAYHVVLSDRTGAVLHSERILKQ